MRCLCAALTVAVALTLGAAAQAATASTQRAVSAQTLKSTLDRDLKRALETVRKLDLATVEAKGFTLKGIRALAAGKVSFVVTAKGVTVARGSRNFAGRGDANVRMRLTRTGKRLLRKASRIRLTVRAKFTARTGRRVGTSRKVTLKRIPPPVPLPPIPPNVTPLYWQTFDSRAPWSGLSAQCAHPVQWARENGDGYAHFEVRPDDPLVAGHERCEVSHGGFGKALPPGEYWYRARQRTGVGFPFEWGSKNWANVLQWHEDEPAPGKSTGTVDGAIFVNSAASGTERMYLEGDHIGFSQSGVFDIHTWHDFVVHGVWTDQPNGYLEWWIDGVYVGRKAGVTSETGGRHFWKGGVERATDLDTLQSADISSVEIYGAP
jgi:polysaccharide lyase-like protein